MSPLTAVPLDEIEFRASRASGPGGQNVNRRSTRVEARWNVRQSPALTEEERSRILERLATRISEHGVLRVVAYRERTQGRNRQRALARLQELVREALAEPKLRKKTKPPAAARRARLEAKRRRKRIKDLRRLPTPED
ncbi:MAG TPA: alternative ribosome rescue aminoacyl-tRNA hydrolase ArfB [Gemmatimonadota bacterium]|nr:alternative ribosome rescue aminoacyl-tRNA hydrolase ArfB [Gemmatimonadota bacterium]